MLGVDDYGSDSDGDNGTPSTSLAKPRLPSLPAPKRTVKKITIGLPVLANEREEHDDLEDVRPQSKRPRLESGAGSSSLVSMLPAPKQKTLGLPPPERVLGGGRGKSFVFETSRTAHVPGEKPLPAHTQPNFLPPSVQQKRPNISLDECDPKPQEAIVSDKPDALAVDFFSLSAFLMYLSWTVLTSCLTGNVASSNVTRRAPSGSSSVPSSISGLSSAPVISTFEPPEPSETDEYPGYYQLPSGTWAAHDPTYYAKFAAKWRKDYDAQVRALEKGAAKGFEGFDSTRVEEVDAMKEMEKAKVELRIREERKAITQGAGAGSAKPKMNITVSLPGLLRKLCSWNGSGQQDERHCTIEAPTVHSAERSV